MQPHSRRILPMVPALLAAAASGQSVPTLPAERAFASDWQEAGEPGTVTFHRAVAGDFDGTGDLDLCVLRTLDGVRAAVHLRDAARWNAPRVLEPAIDFAALPGGGPGGADTLMLLVDGGLRAAGFGQTEVHAAVAPPMSRLFAVDGPGGSSWLCGLGLDGSTLHRWEWSAGALTPRAPIGLAPQVADLRSLDWDRDGEPELAVLFDDGNDFWAVVVSFEATVVLAGWQLGRGTDAAPPRIAVSRNSAPDAAPFDGDVLAVYTWNSLEYVLVALCAGADPVLLGLGELPARTFDAFDHDGDGRQDLALGHALASEVHVLQRHPDGQFAAVGRAPLIAGASHPSSPVDVLLARDLDHDGDGDFVALQDAPRAVQTYDSALRPSLRPIDPVAEVEATSWSAGGQPTPLAIELTVPLELPTPATLHAEVWLQPAENEPVALQPYTHATTPWDGQSSVVIHVPMPAVMPPTVPVLHVHLWFEVAGVHHPAALLYATQDGSTAADVIADLVQRERGFTEPPVGGGEGSISGNKSNKTPTP
jgi:hypothetical protein